MRPLVQGRVLCGLCGARMRVRYQEVGGKQEPYYQCAEASVRQAGKLCQSIRGRCIDAAISELLLATVAPTALEVALAVQEEISERIEQSEALRQTRLEGARYEAELARRRFFNVDPDNRLAADALEADWNERLRQLDALQHEQQQQRQADQGLLDDEARQRVLALAHDFPRLWNDSRTAPIERKRMLALLIEDVTLTKDSEVTVQIRFRGGKTASLTLPRPLPMSRIRKTLPAVVEALDQLLDTCTDRQAALQLNELGHRNWKGELFSEKKVSLVRRTYGLKSRLERLRARGFLTGEQLAKQLGVSTTTIHNWGRAGLLQRELYGNATRCLYAPINKTVPVKGRGGRRSTPPSLIDVPLSSQEIV